jgi:hypothetical protein
VATKVFPFPSDAPPGTLPFVRETISRIESLENAMASGSTEQNSTNRGLNSTLQALSEQIAELNAVTAELAATTADLAQRKFYVAEETYAVDVPVGTALPWTSPLLAATTFTLTSRRKVQLQIQGHISFDFRYLGGATPVLPAGVIQLVLNVNGDESQWTTYTKYGATSVVGENTYVTQSAPAMFSDVRALDPGTYTVGMKYKILTMTGDTGDFSLSHGRTMVMVGDAD